MNTDEEVNYKKKNMTEYMTEITGILTSVTPGTTFHLLHVTSASLSSNCRQA